MNPYALAPASETAVERAAARRDALDWAIKTGANDCCEDCGESLKGKAAFRCVLRDGGLDLYCCARCASAPEVTALAHWRRVELARSGRVHP